MKRFALKAFAAAALCFAVQGVALAQAAVYPNKPVKIIVPFTPGGSNDVLARVIGQKLGPALKQPVVVENKAGAAGNIGTEATVKAPPDGHTLLLAPNNVICVNPPLYPKLGFDPVKDLAPVSVLGTLPIVLIVDNALPVKSVKELVAYAKSKPGELTYASGGSGSPQHLSAELFKQLASVDMLHIPYKGSAPAVNDMVGGQVQVFFSPITAVLPFIKNGRVRAIAVAGSKRSVDLPDLPTISEAGVPGYSSEIFAGLMTPTGTPKDVVERLNQEVHKILGEADTKDKLAAQGIEVVQGGPADLAKMIASDCARWGKLIKELGVRID
ncbi:MAG: LacI family transcriptional regulator [Noviherbaspirillum sp.]|nr:LacI family transcriptional regulator [Noviherbaspirillum sp.]